ncbi:MAG: hypothetical protein QM765_28450 [Myxococcales bacterium]
MTQVARISVVAVGGFVLTVVLEVVTEHPYDDHLHSAWPFFVSLVGFFWANYQFMPGGRPRRVLLGALIALTCSCAWELVTMVLAINFLAWLPAVLRR